MVYIFNIIISLCALSGGVFAIIPDYIKVCKREQSTINECVRDSIYSIRPHLISGIPELNVPPLEPFYIPEIIAVSGDLIPLKASGKDVKVTGTGNFSIKSVKFSKQLLNTDFGVRGNARLTDKVYFGVDVETLAIRAKVRFPRLHLDGLYNLDTQILIVPLRGEGKLLADAVKCDAEIVLTSEVYQKDGQEYLKFSSLTVDINIKDYRLRLDGLFNGNKALGDATNEAINQNRGEFLKTMQPYIEKTVAKIFLDSANKIVANIPLSELLPKS